MLRFGGLFQASCLVDLVRDQAIKSGTVAIKGLGTLGLWTMAANIAQVPFALFGILGRVAFPTIARLIHADNDPVAELEGAMETVAVPLGLLSVGLIGTGPVLVPLIFGSPWRAAVSTLPWIGLGLLLTAPVNVVLGGYLLARNKPGTVLWANAVEVAVSVGVTLPLLPFLGVQAIGLGLLAGAIVDMPIFRAAVRPWARPRVAVCIAPQVVGTVLASAAGWFAAKALGDTIISLLVSGVLAGSLYLAFMGLVCRPALIRCVRYARSALSTRSPAGAV